MHAGYATSSRTHLNLKKKTLSKSSAVALALCSGLFFVVLQLNMVVAGVKLKSGCCREEANLRGAKLNTQILAIGPARVR